MTLKEAYIVLRRALDLRESRDRREYHDIFPEDAIINDVGDEVVNKALTAVLTAQGLGKPRMNCLVCRYYRGPKIRCRLRVVGECTSFEEKKEVTP